MKRTVSRNKLKGLVRRHKPQLGMAANMDLLGRPPEIGAAARLSGEVQRGAQKGQPWGTNSPYEEAAQLGDRGIAEQPGVGVAGSCYSVGLSPRQGPLVLQP
uniref:Uncharacterized protein n=1 Tax=Sphaerodactylus townsendi TaxID=933632 RepID=A0ACB8GDQ8_9SAUR